MANDEPQSPLDALVAAVQSALSAKRAMLEDRVQAIELALLGYRRAAEADIAREFAAEHGLKQPPAPPLNRERAAEILLNAVRALPELRNAASSEPEPDTERGTQPPQRDSVAPPAVSSGDHRLLAAELQRGKLVIVGGLVRRERPSGLPAELLEHIEWIDTEHDGSHAIGNLPQRIRQGRVAALIILQRAVQHRHTEAVMLAARDVAIPVAYAGQGGKGALRQAVEQLEAMLKRASSSA